MIADLVHYNVNGDRNDSAPALNDLGETAESLDCPTAEGVHFYCPSSAVLFCNKLYNSVLSFMVAEGVPQKRTPSTPDGSLPCLL